MAGTPKNTRQPPERLFEHYVLTRVTSRDAGLTNISDSAFQNIPASTISNVTGEDDIVSELVDIGFDFVFDGVTYTNIVICTNGWMALADPTQQSSTYVRAQLMSSGTYRNEGIKEVITGSALLCPWYDDLKNVSGDLQYATTTGGSSLSSNEQLRVLQGIDVPPLSFSQSSYAVKIYYEKNSAQGRRTIVRWNSLSDYQSASTVLKFEVVLYENGTIEFRYEPRKSLVLEETTSGGNYIEDATIGIFTSGTYRFRDFSYGLGYLDSSRQQYKYGGAIYDSSFYDNGWDTSQSSSFTLPYVWRLRPATHWPGLSSVGSMFVFSPPKDRRKILPRKEIRNIDSHAQPPVNNIAKRFSESLFDDRVTTNFVSGVVNYPTTLPRFLGGNTKRVSLRQDLFIGQDKDFNVTSSIVKSAVEQFVGVVDDSLIEPFNEASHQSIGSGSHEDLFFISGSQNVDNLSQPLWSKSQIKLSLNVSNNTMTFGTSASIYYYNTRYKTWMLPRNTVTNGSDIANPSSFVTNGRVLEDHRGFGPIGNYVVSGSNAPSGETGTDIHINTPYTFQNVSDALNRSYGKSVLNNDDYEATGDETLTLAISQPFLIQKAIIELPVTAGDGWFSDKTTSFIPLSSSMGTFDFAGPGVTFALMNQVNLGNGSRRDLILTGTFTHTNDLVKEITISNFPSLTTDFQVRPTGFLAYASQPAGVISPPSNNSFTGTVTLKTEPLISNGPILKITKDMLNVTAATNRTEVLSLLDADMLSLVSGSDEFALGFNIAHINAFGRSGTARASGRSVFGREFVTTQGVIDSKGNITNPFYVTGSSRDTLEALVTSGSRFRAVAALPIAAHHPSPYVVMPEDKLVLSIAKSRPFFYGEGLSGPRTSGSIAHDLSLMSGTVNITLYGTFLSDNKEFNNVHDQNTASDSIHEVIGNDPVLDQYDVSYTDEFIGGMYDDYITGSIINVKTGINQKTYISSSIRGRVFSKYSARSQAVPDTSGHEVFTNPSLSFRTQPWYERVGTSRFVQHFDANERFWDSMMPSIAECFTADGTGIAIVEQEAGTFGNAQSVLSASIGYMIFDFNVPTLSSELFNVINGNWTWAYPYEPRYLNAPRQKDINKSFLATYVLSASTAGGSATFYVSQITPKPISSFYFGPVSPGVFTWVADVNLGTTTASGHYPTSSAGTSDVVKALYGFGDERSVSLFGGQYQVGTNHFAISRHSHLQISSAGTFFNGFRYGQLIRGWKYGVYSGHNTHSKAVFSRKNYGQFRDMLEQRQYTKFYIEPTNNDPIQQQEGELQSPIQVKFLDAAGNLTDPENTTSQNLSMECTSSIPFFDGVARDRSSINKFVLNSNILSLVSDQFNNVSI